MPIMPLLTLKMRSKWSKMLGSDMFEESDDDQDT